MTFGDVLSIALMVVLTITTTWAGIVAFSVIFSARARAAATALTDRPGRQVGIGVILFGLAAAGSVSLASKGGPVAIVGFMIIAAVLAVAVLGSAGLALVVSERLRALDPKYSALEATARGAGLCVAAGLIPVIGWFFLFPAAVWASLGAGFTALTARKQPVFLVEKTPAPIAEL
jgi:hypothetical protein